MVVQQTHPKREDSNRVKVIVSPVGRQGRPGTPGVSIRFFDTLQEALDLQPRPENGVTFQVREETDPENFGFYVFDDREPEGYRYLGERWDDEYLTQIENRIDAFEQDVEGQVQGLETRVEDVETDVSGFKAEVEDRVEGVESDVSGFKAEVNQRVEDAEDAVQSLQDTTARYAFDTLQEAQDKWANFSQEEKDELEGREYVIDDAVYKWTTTQPQYSDFLRFFETGIETIGTELNLIKRYLTIDGSRTTDSGAILNDNNFFRTSVIPVQEGVRYATVSNNLSVFPRFTFYSSENAGAGTFVSLDVNREAVVPAGATHMIISAPLSQKDSFILMQLDSGFPSLRQNTFRYNDLYTKEEVDNLKVSKSDITPSLGFSETKIPNQKIVTEELNKKIDLEEIGSQENLLKKPDTVVTIGERLSNSGQILTDNNFFRTNAIPVTEGDRYASVSNVTGFFPVFSFFDSATIGSSSFISNLTARDAVVPTGATHLVIHQQISQLDSFIVMQMGSGFPVLGQDTINYNGLYDKNEIDDKLDEIDDKFDNLNIDLAEWYPDVFELEIIDEITARKVLYISESDILYGTNGYRDIFKASNVDLSDRETVCVLPSNSSLHKLLFVSETKAVGYVRSSDNAEDEGFYVFDNADSDTWTPRRVGKMLAGHPATEFQSLIRCSTNGYLFSCSYSSGVNGGKSLEGAIRDPAPIHIYRSVDDGESWQVVYEHSVSLNTHMHAIEFDPYRERVWCLIGDEGDGGRPGWAWSDDYGDTWDFVENNDAEGQPPFMDTAIIPTRKYVLIGTDFHPAGIRKWEPSVDEKNADVRNDDVTNAYLIPIEQQENFGFAKNPVVDISSYPYRIGMAISHNSTYSKSCVLLSPNFKDWFMFDLVNDPQTEVSWSSFSGITSDGWVLGWCTLTSDGTQYYRRFRFPKWIKN